MTNDKHTEPTWANQLWHARRMESHALRPHASVSLDNQHRCEDCFCCATLTVLEERKTVPLSKHPDNNNPLATLAYSYPSLDFVANIYRIGHKYLVTLPGQIGLLRLFDSLEDAKTAQIDAIKERTLNDYEMKLEARREEAIK